MMKVVQAILWLCAVASLVVPASAQKKGIHEDTRKGFRMKLPEKWNTVPVQIDEKWIVAKFQSNRTYETKQTTVYSGAPHRPVILVIEFDNEARKLRVEEEQRGDTTYVNKNTPFRDYKDYVKRNAEAGYYIDKEEESKEAGVRCVKYQVRIEKNADTRKRFLTWVFYGEKGELAVECEVSEDNFEKIEPMMLAALKSFQLIPRTTVEATAAITGSEGGDTMWTTDRRKWRELSVEDRQRRRKRIEAERLEKSQKDLLAGWTAKRTKHYLVLSHADAKYTARIVEAIETYRTWLEQEFDSVSDEYVMHGVIRICADLSEAQLYTKASGNEDSFNPDNREVVTYQDKSEGNAGVSWGRLFVGMFAQYIYDKDALLYSYMPGWSRAGLYNYVRSAKIKGGKLTFEPEDNENNYIREVERAGEFAALKELMGPKLDGEMKTDTDTERAQALRWVAQTSRLMRWILGPGTKFPEMKDFVVDYMKRIIVIAEELDETQRNTRADANSEEEELKRTQDRKTYWTRVRTEILTRIDADKKWSEETWSTLQKAFHEFLKK